METREASCGLGQAPLPTEVPPEPQYHLAACFLPPRPVPCSQRSRKGQMQPSNVQTSGGRVTQASLWVWGCRSQPGGGGGRESRRRGGVLKNVTWGKLGKKEKKGGGSRI